MINYVYLKQSLPNINFHFSFILAETHIMKKKTHTMNDE